MGACVNCGHDNAQEARFCAECGAKLERSISHQIRKTVTVVFADVTGSTALGEQLDPESFRTVMSRFFELAQASLERHAGTVEKFIGDAVMAVFGVPLVHEDDALRAVRAVSDIQSSLVRLNGELWEDFGVSLQVRIGVNTGEVITGTAERLATGDAVNIAARLEQAAAPGEVLLGDQTRHLASAEIVVEPVGELALKGKSVGVAAYRLVRMRDDVAFVRGPEGPLVGRRVELDRIRAAFDRAMNDRVVQMVTVLGPPGIGKSRLAREVAAALDSDAGVLVGRCLPYGEGITFWAIREIFAAVGDESQLTSALTAGGTEETFWAIRKWVERRAQDRPVVLVFEDIHWAEPVLLDLIEYLYEWSRHAQLMLLCLARPEFIDGRPGWGQGRANTTTLILDRLGDEETRELVANLFGSSLVAPENRQRIREVSGGNPLFVEQLAASLADGGDLTGIPPTIHALLAARLDTLAADARDVLERASVVGLEFEWNALAQLDPAGRRPPGSLMSGLVRNELISPHESHDDTFRFHHALIRDVAYERISKESRADLHGRMADWLDEQGQDYEAVVGYHLEQAARSLAVLGRTSERREQLERRASARLGAAALRAAKSGDVRGSSGLLQRAVALLPPDDPARVSLLRELGRSLRESEDLDGADRVLAEAVECARSAGDRVLAADAALALADLRLQRSVQTGVSRDDVLREIDTAIHTFTDLRSDLGLGRAMCLQGKLRYWAGEAGAATVIFEQAAGHSHRAGDAGQEAESLQYVLSTIERGPMPVRQALERCATLEGRTLTNHRLEVGLLSTQSNLEAMQMRFDVARGLLARARSVAEEYGLPNGYRLNAGYIELMAGNTSAAEQELWTTCEALERIGELGYLASVIPLLIDAVLAQGRNDEALRLTERWRPEQLTVAQDADAQAGWRRVRAKALAGTGQVVEAELVARDAIAIASATDFVELHAWSLANLAGVVRRAGRAEEATSVAAQAIRLLEQKGNLALATHVRAE